jgi:acetolactate synthase-1/2/3 large subunit
MKYSDLLGEWLTELGYTHCFFVAGGGIMHLLDGFRKKFECIPVVHEMTAGIAAEHFNQCAQNKNRAFALVTTGPGLTNIVTAIAGCYVEHRELLVISGQVKSTDLLKHPERQRGVQEIDGKSICTPISVQSFCMRTPMSRSKFKEMAELARSPHPGPVVIEVCLDVQGADVNREELATIDLNPVDKGHTIQAEEVQRIIEKIKDAKRPLIIFGGLLSRDAAWHALNHIEKIGVPICTTTSAIDRIPTNSPIFAGRPGTWGGQRAGNLIVAQADFLLVIGAQLDLQQTGFNYQEYAPNAKIVHIFPSQAELDRVGPEAFLKLKCSPDRFLEILAPLIRWKDTDEWGKYVQDIRSSVPTIEPSNTHREEFINSFLMLKNLSLATRKSDILAMCSSGGTFTGALQNFEIAPGQLATTSAAHASMGYGLATAIGAAFSDRSKRVILTEGEGGFSQNLQELAVVSRFKLPLKIFIFDNNGYASIRATQKKFFNGDYLGCDPETGLGFPDWVKLFNAYDIPCRYMKSEENNKDDLKLLMENCVGPEAWIISVDPLQPNWPAVSTVISHDGQMRSSPLYDMLPKLSSELSECVGRYLPNNLGASS